MTWARKAAVPIALLLLVDFALVVGAWALYKRHWAKPEYTLFWRHATSW